MSREEHRHPGAIAPPGQFPHLLAQQQISHRGPPLTAVLPAARERFRSALTWLSFRRSRTAACIPLSTSLRPTPADRQGRKSGQAAPRWATVITVMTGRSGQLDRCGAGEKVGERGAGTRGPPKRGHLGRTGEQGASPGADHVAGDEGRGVPDERTGQDRQADRRRGGDEDLSSGDAQARLERCDRGCPGLDRGELVPGNLARISQGEIVPAGSFVSAGRCEVDESALTGESLPVPKGSA